MSDETVYTKLDPNLPAACVTTPLEWSDLVLDAATLQDLDDIVQWTRHGETLLDDWKLGRRMGPGYRSLFWGPPGTGKTLAAALLGKVSGRDVYRVDLGRIIAKYIGETEKNLDTLFAQARARNWILFFDEADSLFGARTAAESANDRAANQQIAYLLQCLEDFPVVVILASNVRSFADEAFARRFQSIIHFAMPNAEQRMKLWKDIFADQTVAADVDFTKLAQEHEVAGGAIVNVLLYACIQAVRRGSKVIAMRDLLAGLERQSRAASG